MVLDDPISACRSVCDDGPLFVTAGQAFVSRCLGEGALGVPLLVSYPGLDVRELWAVWSPELF